MENKVYFDFEEQPKGLSLRSFNGTKRDFRKPRHYG